jgi:tetratricopeptide (TPR) repeat protein
MLADERSPDLTTALELCTTVTASGSLRLAGEIVDHVRSVHGLEVDEREAGGSESRGRQTYGQDVDAEDRRKILADMLDMLAMAFLAHGQRLDAALSAYEERLQLLAQTPDDSTEAIGRTLCDIADVRLGQGETELAIKLYQEAIERLHDADSKARVTALIGLGAGCLQASEHGGAAQAGQQAIKLLRGEPSSDPNQLVAALVLTARAALDRPEPNAALPLLQEAHELAAGGSDLLTDEELATIRELLASARAAVSEDADAASPAAPA